MALLAAALAATPGAQAAADAGPVGPRSPEGASAVLDGLKTYGQAVLHSGDGSVRQIPAGLYEMRVDGGGMLQTYGVGVEGNAQPQSRYTESGWSGSPLSGKAEAGRIRWILEHSYPQRNDLAGLAKAAGAGALTAESAAAGTQVAIWRLADGARVEAADPAAELLADYLQREAGQLPEPPASLMLDPGDVYGPVGSRLGPVTVRTGALTVSVIPDAAALAMGVRVVDAEGRPVETAANGSRLYFDVPAGTPDGIASVTVRGATRVPVGRVFTSGVPAQAQIVAGSSESAAKATATAIWPQAAAADPAAAGATAATAAGATTGAASGGVAGSAGTAGAAGSSGTAGTAETAGAVGSSGTGPLGAQSSALSPQSPDEERLASSGSSAATPVIASMAVGLVVLGGLVVLLLRKRPLDGEEQN
ncbi:thioester domain-containing protein [Streptomyces sp. NPDC058674]|uniref:thioester domain-containing protein n=1 Tax=Streptomyces sp. NPDC058674 TaxID=3346592 RepID=UPI00364E1943